MKVKVSLAVAKHETKYGVDTYVRQVKKGEDINTLFEEMAEDCNYEEGTAGEYFDADIEELVIDTDDCEPV